MLGFHTKETRRSACLVHDFIQQDTAIQTVICGYLLCKACGFAMLNNPQIPVRFFRPSRLNCQGFSFSGHPNVLENMIKKQPINRPVQSRHINFNARLDSIAGLKALASALVISPCTLFKAVSIMDWVISNSTYQQFEYKIILILSLSLACKLGEKAEKVLTEKEIAYYLAPFCKEEQVACWELKLLTVLNWQPNILNTFDFVEFFLVRGVFHRNDLPNLVPPALIESFASCLDEIIWNFLHLTIDNFAFYHFKPLGLAASIIACSRGMMRLAHWNDELQVLTGLSPKSIQKSVNVLMESINNDTIKQSFISIIKSHFGGKSAPCTPQEFIDAEILVSQVQLLSSHYEKRPSIPMSLLSETRYDTEEEVTKRRSSLRLGPTGSRHQKITKRARYAAQNGSTRTDGSSILE